MVEKDMNQGDGAELARLRAEADRLRQDNARLRGRLSAHESTLEARRRIGWRNALATVLVVLSALMLVSGAIGTWTRNTALDNEKFVARVGPIIDQPEVQAAVANRLSTQINVALNTEERLKSRLPENLVLLSGPVASGVETIVNKEVLAFVGTEAFRSLWFKALSFSQQRVAATLEGENPNIETVDGQVVVNLISVVDQVLLQLSQQLPEIFGSDISLSLPDNLTEEQIAAVVQKYFGVTLPPDFATVPIMAASTLESAQNAVDVVSTLDLVLLVGAVVLLVAGLLLARDRRRTLVWFGCSVAVTAAVVFFALRWARKDTISGISEGTMQAAADSAVTVVFETLRWTAWIILGIGLLIALVAALAGPGRFARATRAQVAAAGRAVGRGARNATGSDAQHWVADHADALRLGGVAVAVLVLIFWSSWIAFWIIAALLVAYLVVISLVSHRAGFSTVA